MPGSSRIHRRLFSTLEVFKLANVSIIPNEGEVDLLEALRTGRLQGATLDLWVNDYTPGPATTLNDLTVLSDPQYSSITLNSWTAAALNALGRAETTHPQVQWSLPNPIAATTIYGNVLHTGGIVLMARRFLNPIDTSGGNVLVPQNPRFYLFDDS